jgi:hypothetical protein
MATGSSDVPPPTLSNGLMQPPTNRHVQLYVPPPAHEVEFVVFLFPPGRGSLFVLFLLES